MKFDALHRLVPRWGGADALIVLCGSLAVFVAAIGLHGWVKKTSEDEAVAARHLRRRLAEARQVATPASAPAQDFTRSLPTSVSVDKLVQALQRSAQAFGVVLVNISSEPRAETTQALPRLEVTLTLKGGYPALKSTLAEAPDRFPNAAIEQMGVKRDASVPGSEELIVRIALPTRPLAAER